jgi:glutathione S-transferase
MGLIIPRVEAPKFVGRARLEQSHARGAGGTIMLTFYYYPGACSMAAHVALEETGTAYERKSVDLRAGEQNGEAFRRINPRGEVPVLSVSDKVITQSVAILTYVGRQFPHAGLLPPDVVDEARCLAIMAWISSTVDPLFRRLARPERFVADEAARLAVKEAAGDAYWAKCQEIDALLAGKAWMMGAQYTVCDPYALVYYGWAARFGLPVKDLVAYTRLKDRLLERPAVRRVLEREQSALLGPTPTSS